MAGDTVIMDAKMTAQYLGIAAQTLARWRVEGRGPIHIKVGSAVRYDVRDLDSWLAMRRRHSTAEEALDARVR